MRGLQLGEGEQLPHQERPYGSGQFGDVRVIRYGRELDAGQGDPGVRPTPEAPDRLATMRTVRVQPGAQATEDVGVGEQLSVSLGDEVATSGEPPIMHQEGAALNTRVPQASPRQCSIELFTADLVFGRR